MLDEMRKLRGYQFVQIVPISNKRVGDCIAVPNVENRREYALNKGNPTAHLAMHIHIRTGSGLHRNIMGSEIVKSNLE